MARLLTLVAIVLVLVWWLRSKRRPPHEGDNASFRKNTISKPLPMVACHHCGTHLPQQEARRHQGQWYCSLAHQDASDAA